MQALFTIVFVLGPVLTSIVDACGRKPSRTMPSTDSVDSTTVYPLNRRGECSPPEKLISQCLNGGRCFAVDLGINERILSCQCLPPFRGKRCEELDITNSFVTPEERIRTASIAAGATTLVIVAVAGICCFVIWMRKSVCESSQAYNTRDRRKKKNQANGGNSSSVSSSPNSMLKSNRSHLIPGACPGEQTPMSTDSCEVR